MTQSIESSSNKNIFSAQQIETLIGGQPVVKLHAPYSPEAEKPSIISAQILPGRGMNIYQLKTCLPYKGDFDMLYAPPLKETSHFFDNGPDDFMGNKSFMIGGAILVPYPNRIRGKLLADGKSIETRILGKTVILPANWSSAGNTRGEKVAMHGLILNSKMNKVTLHSSDSRAEVTGVFNAGDFDGRWIGQSRLTMTCTLTKSNFSFSVTVENVGNETLPTSVGWHPYFEFPSGKREQVRIHIPARSIVQVNNYDDVFPLGEIIPIKGYVHDFSDISGTPLKDMYLDDSFTDLKINPEDNSITEIIDPLANYGVRIFANSVNKAIQVYAPPDKNFIAIEPQFNLTDPFNENTWGKNANKGMAILEPGQSVIYKVKIELFIP